MKCQKCRTKLDAGETCGLCRVHPDRAESALRVLKELSTLDVTDLTVDDVKADPTVEGVWGVHRNGGLVAVVYLAGARGPWGMPRDFNDFETAE